MKVLITGSSGFIGYWVSKELLNNGYKVFGIDNHNDYYDIKLKKFRNKELKKNKNFYFSKIDITSIYSLKNFFKKNKIKYIVHLAAQAGVRYSIYNPKTYFDNNVLGFFNILNIAKEFKIRHLVFASTSSVYGDVKNFPLKESEHTSNPKSFYAATKKCNEVMGYSYSKIYDLNMTALRFFTVFGPLGRPDMSLFNFVNNMIRNKNINLFNHGRHIRDFTYVEDVAKSVHKVLLKIPKKNDRFRIINIAGGNKNTLRNYVRLIQKNLNKKKIKIKYFPLQKGDVYKTEASIKRLKKIIKFVPNTKLDIGIKKYVKWFRTFYKI